MTSKTRKPVGLQLSDEEKNEENHQALISHEPNILRKRSIAEAGYKSTNFLQFTSKPPFLAVCSLLPTVFVAVIGWTLVPYFLKQLVLNKIVLSQSTNPELYDAWVHPPFPIYFKAYMFNVTNSDEVRQGGFPKFQEIGPYVFTENRTKLNIIHDDLTDSATYNEYIIYHFAKHLSGNLSLDDKFTILNVPYAAAAIKIDGVPWPMNELGKTILLGYKEPLFVEKTVAEALFQGWKVPFLESIEEDLGLSLIPNNTFAYFHMQNDSMQGPFTISRGTYNKPTFGSLMKFKNKASLDYWGDPTSPCNQLEGTDGTLFPPLLTQSRTLKIFIPEFCRHLDFNYLADLNLGEIKSYRFTPRQMIQQNPLELDTNHCYCDYFYSDPGKCLKQGVFDIGPCRDGAPIALSAPHFLDGDKEYIEKSGLNPVREKHETFLDIEPVTGVILRARKRIQINLILKKVKGFSSLKRVPDMLFPLVWAEESAEVDEPLTTRLEENLNRLFLVDFIFKWPLIVFVLFATAMCCFRKLYTK